MAALGILFIQVKGGCQTLQKENQNITTKEYVQAVSILATLTQGVLGSTSLVADAWPPSVASECL